MGSKLKDSITSLVPGKKQQQPDSSRLQQRSPYGRDGELVRAANTAHTAHLLTCGNMKTLPLEQLQLLGTPSTVTGAARSHTVTGPLAHPHMGQLYIQCSDHAEVARFHKAASVTFACCHRNKASSLLVTLTRILYLPHTPWLHWLLIALACKRTNLYSNCTMTHLACTGLCLQRR